jgi:hypothetical protein
MAVAFVDHQISTFTAAATITDVGTSIGATATAVIAFVAVGTNNISTTLSTCSGVTWGGVTMPLIGSKTQSDGLANVYAFGLASPATGARTTVISLTGGTFADCGVYLGIASFKGTSLTTSVCFPSANVLTDATTPTGTVYPVAAISVTTASGDAACAGMNCNNNQFSTMNTGTLLDTSGAVQGNFTDGYKLSVGATTTLQFGTGTSGSPACAVAFRIQQPQSTTVNWSPYLADDMSAINSIIRKVAY